ncbi:hypothetical protein WJX74_010701 [Apatococcus lobatus]|uniref:Uncharacterized protein n=1 Tax=Apatococcus lobatus TaxID=904363 RepID=A0AAW1RTR5_9CHLO
MDSNQKEALDEGSTLGKFPVARYDQAAHNEALANFSRRLESLGLPRCAASGTLSSTLFEERLPLVWLLHEVLHCCQVSAQVQFLKENRYVAKQLWRACEQLSNHSYGSLPSGKQQAFAAFLAMLLIRLTSRSRSCHAPAFFQTLPSKEEVSKEASRTSIRLLLLKRQQLLMRILIWNIEHVRVQQAWTILASNACTCGHGDAICAEANIDHMLAFGKLAVASLAARLRACGQQGEWQERDPASSCLSESCILAAEAINTAVSAMYNSQACSADPDAEFEPSHRVQELLISSADLAQHSALELLLTRLAEPLMVHLIQSILQLQALPVVLLRLDSVPAIVDAIFRSPHARFDFQTMLRTKLFQLGSHQEHFLRHGSQFRPSFNTQVNHGTQTLGALPSKLIQVLKLLIMVMKLAEELDHSQLWQALQNMLMEGHSDHAQTQLSVGQLTSKTIGNWSESSLLQATTSCYKGYLSIANKELQDYQHLARLTSSNTFATKSYWQHQRAVHRHGTGALQSFGSSDAVAPLITRLLARLLNPRCLPVTAHILMLDSGLPEAVLELVGEASYFDHWEILMKAMIKCGCESWIPQDQESSLAMMSALLRSRDEDVQAIVTRCQQQAEDARLAKKAERWEQSQAQIRAAEEAQARRAAEEAERRRAVEEAYQAEEARRAKADEEARRKKANKLARQDAAIKAKAAKAAGSSANEEADGKGISQPLPDQAKTPWISAIPSWFQGRQGQDNPDDKHQQDDSDDDSRRDTRPDCWKGGSKLQGAIGNGLLSHAEAKAAQKQGPSPASSHGNSDGHQDPPQATIQAPERLANQDRSNSRANKRASSTATVHLQLREFQHNQADDFAQSYRGGMHGGLQSHPLQDALTSSSPRGLRRQPAGDDLAVSIAVDQEPLPTTGKSASDDVDCMAAQSGQSVQSFLNPDPAAGNCHDPGAATMPQGAGAKQHNAHVAAAVGHRHSQGTSPSADGNQDVLQDAAAVKECSQPYIASTSPELRSDFEEQGPLLHDQMLWPRMEQHQGMSPAALPGSGPGSGHAITSMHHADSAASSPPAPAVPQPAMPLHESGTETASPKPFGWQSGSSEDVFGLRATAGQNTMLGSHSTSRDPAARPQPEQHAMPDLSSGPAPPKTGNPFAPDAPPSSSSADGMMQDPGVQQASCSLHPHERDISQSAFDGGFTGSDSSKQTMQNPFGCSGLNRSHSAMVERGHRSSAHSEDSSNQEEVHDATIHAAETCRSAGHSKAGEERDPAVQSPSQQGLITAGHSTQGRKGSSASHSQECDRDANHQPPLDQWIATLTSRMSGISLSDDQSQPEPVQRLSSSSSTLEPQHSQAGAEQANRDSETLQDCGMSANRGSGQRSALSNEGRRVEGPESSTPPLGRPLRGSQDSFSSSGFSDDGPPGRDYDHLSSDASESFCEGNQASNASLTCPPNQQDNCSACGPRATSSSAQGQQEMFQGGPHEAQQRQQTCCPSASAAAPTGQQELNSSIHPTMPHWQGNVELGRSHDQQRIETGPAARSPCSCSSSGPSSSDETVQNAGPGKAGSEVSHEHHRE